LDEIRSQVLQEVKEYFVGPREEDEKIKDDPLETYISGVLHPQNAPEEEMDDGNSDAGRDDNENPDDGHGIETKKMLRQNSVGLRVHLKDDVEKIEISVNYARYFDTDDGEFQRKDLYKRNVKNTIPIKLGDVNGEHEFMDDTDEPEAKVTWYYHKPTRVLNVFLENSKEWEEEKKDDKGKIIVDSKVAYRHNNTNSIFQPLISINTLSNDSPFEEISTSNNLFTSLDDEKIDVLYKNKKIYGEGYSCAAEWKDAKGGPLYVNTQIIPDFEQKQIQKFSHKDGKDERPSSVDMYELAFFDSLDNSKANRKVIHERLSPLITQYKEWIGDKRKASSGKGIEKMNLDNCEDAMKRMEEGLETITEENGDEKILKAFILANRAMVYQRLHFEYALQTSKGMKLDFPDIKKAKHPMWYPFQIAFLLMSINGIADKSNKDNDIADLIWFPTGGGKTEAYLGVAAFTMLLRRLKGEGVGGLGVSVIMRYTLRLLTLQQFERASTMICALEKIRRDDIQELLGEHKDEPFLLGMWVGYSLTPNHYGRSNDALKDYWKWKPNYDRAEMNEGSPWQNSYCPWCGHPITPDNYRVDEEYTKWTTVRCSNNNGPCIFKDTNHTKGKVLPLVTVDSDIYYRCPSMIIATVDKFARLPFRQEIGNIFGRAQRRCQGHGFIAKGENDACKVSGGHKNTGHIIEPITGGPFPPDLFIQDELHLISGPLGTMVGLYETAVDFLCRKKINGKETRPKLIASTATVKGAQDQIRKIFNIGITREFPSPGINRSDSFFWWETEETGKMFAGMSFSRRSQKYALARAYAAMLQRVNFLRKDVENNSSISDDTKLKRIREGIDPYWTLVGYYNSIRELGGATRLMEDDVKTNLGYLSKTVYGRAGDKRETGTHENGIEELTGRKNQSEINKIRDKLEEKLPSEDAISVLLATNMISVGVDITRLGLMLVNGHPKSATEYIQTTGRIGRSEGSPGMVFTLYNPYKPRDLSQYENFNGFHNTMQKYVEPSTITPFSVRSYTRAIHAVFIAMIRLSIPTLSEKRDAHQFKIRDGQDAERFILERFKNVEIVDEDSDSFKNFKRKVTVFQQDWKKYIDDSENDDEKGEVWYNNPYGDKTKHEEILMIEFANARQSSTGIFPKRTPESLREVEQQLEMEYE
tara:strand:+ start:2294 stop:5758 length:3465 start_codon:yes stop_codon:yes gene_type:complete